MVGAILVRESWDVQVYERAVGGLESRGTGIATHDEMFAALARAGARGVESAGREMNLGLSQ